MTKPTTIHGRSGKLWFSGEETAPPHAVEVKDWTYTEKTECPPDDHEDSLRRSRPLLDITGWFSGHTTMTCTPARRVPGRRKAMRMRMRGY